MSLVVRMSDGVCELHVAAPPGNVVSRALCREITDAVRTHAEDPGLQAFVFTAAGKHFSYGASVPEHVAGEVESFLPAFHGVFDALLDAAVPTVAAVQGLCLGGACELALFADFVLAEQSARFAVPEIQLGVIPPVACVVFPWRFGGARSAELILTGEKVAAADVGARVCEDGELAAFTETFLDTYIRPRSAAVLRLATRAARAPLAEDLRRRLPELERTYLLELMAMKDPNEGVLAFLEKREPAWTNA